MMTDFEVKWDLKAREIHRIAVEHGWWETDRSVGEVIALIHSELSEGLEAARHDDPPSEHIPEFTGLEEELADAVIRIMDYSIRAGLRVGAAIEAKVRFNETRPYKHGGKKF